MPPKFPAFTEASAQMFLKHHPRVSREEAADAWEKLNSMGVPSDRMYEALDKWFAPTTGRRLSANLDWRRSRRLCELERDKDNAEVQDIYSLSDTRRDFRNKDGKPIGRFLGDPEESWL